MRKATFAKALQESLKVGHLQANNPADTGTLTSPSYSVGSPGPTNISSPGLLKLTNTQLALLNAEMGGKLDFKSPLISDVVKVLTEVPGTELFTINTDYYLLLSALWRNTVAYCSYDTLLIVTHGQ